MREPNLPSRSEGPLFLFPIPARLVYNRQQASSSFEGATWSVEIEVVRRGGPPQLRFHDGAAARMASLGATRALVTLTHSRELAIAHVMLLK